jgi:hypothetical protein
MRLSSDALGLEAQPLHQFDCGLVVLWEPYRHPTQPCPPREVSQCVLNHGLSTSEPLVEHNQVHNGIQTNTYIGCRSQPYYLVSKHELVVMILGRHHSLLERFERSRDHIVERLGDRSKTFPQELKLARKQD